MKNVDMLIKDFSEKYESFLIGCDAIEEEERWNIDFCGEMEAFYANDMTSIILRLIASDGDISQKEVDYLNEAFGFDYTLEELIEVYENCGENIDEAFDENFENGITQLRRINPKLADTYRELLALICLIIIESDGIVAEAEIDEIKRLKALCD